MGRRRGRNPTPWQNLATHLNPILAHERIVQLKGLLRAPRPVLDADSTGGLPRKSAGSTRLIARGAGGGGVQYRKWGGTAFGLRRAPEQSSNVPRKLGRTLCP